MVQPVVAQPVADAHLQFVQAVQHVQLGQRDAVDAAHGDGLAHHHRVEPAAAARPTGDGAELMAALAQPAADGVVQLRRERPGADARGVGLGDAQHIVQRGGPQPGTRRRLPRRGVRGGDERIGAMVHVQHHPLGALEQHPFAGPANLGQRAPGGVGERQDGRRDGEQFVQQPALVDRLVAQAPAQRVVVGQQRVDPRLDGRPIGQVAQPDRPAADLVLVGRADAPAGGADLDAAGGILAQRVQLAVERQDQGAVGGDLERPGGDVDALAGQPVDLLGQRPGVDDHAVADHRQLARPDDARRQQAELVDGAVDDQRVAGVVAALEAHHHVGAFRQPVDDLALAFVAPLGAYHHHIGHGVVLVRCPVSSE